MTVAKINVIEVSDGGGPELEKRFAENIALQPAPAASSVPRCCGL